VLITYLHWGTSIFNKLFFATSCPSKVIAKRKLVRSSGGQNTNLNTFVLMIGEEISKFPKLSWKFIVVIEDPLNENLVETAVKTRFLIFLSNFVSSHIFASNCSLLSISIISKRKRKSDENFKCVTSDVVGVNAKEWLPNSFRGQRCPLYFRCEAKILAL